MSYVDYLCAKLTATISVTHRFRLMYRPDGSAAFIFLESTDDRLFYQQAIAASAKPHTKLHFFYCDGKDGVYDALSFAITNGRLENVVFFVDKDLDDLCGTASPSHERVFVTEHYSVENYLCGDKGLLALLRDHVLVNDENGLYGELKVKLQRFLSEFHKVMLPLMAWAVAHRRKGQKVAFKNFKKSDLLTCLKFDDLNPVATAVCLDHFRKACTAGTDSVVQSEIDSVSEELKRLCPKAWVRGKFELWAFMIFICCVWDGLRGKNISRQKKIKVTVQITQDNIFALLAGKVDMPKGLEQFLCRNLRFADEAAHSTHA